MYIGMAAVLAASCSVVTEHIGPVSEPMEVIEVTAGVGGGPDTKLSFAEADDRVVVKWKEKGEAFSAFVGEGSALDFVQTSKPASDGNVSFIGEIPYATADEADVYAFYPRIPAGTGRADAVGIDLSVQTGARNEMQTYMCASASAGDLRDGARALAFRHLTSTVRLTLNFGASASGPVRNVTLVSDGLVKSAEIDLTASEPAVTPLETGEVALVRTFELKDGRIDIYFNILPSDLGEIRISALADDEYYTGILRGRTVVAGKQYHAGAEMSVAGLKEYKGVVLAMQQFADNDKHFLSTAGNKVYQSSECAANCASIDIVAFYSGASDTKGYAICSPNVNNATSAYTEAYMTGKDVSADNAPVNWTTRNETLFRRLTSAEIDGTKFNALASTRDLENLYENTASSIEEAKRVFQLKLWESIAFKTSDGRYGVMMVTALSGEKTGSITVKYKISDIASVEPVKPSLANKVTVSRADGKWQLLLNGEPMYVKGAATNNFYGDVARFGGNAVRTYSAKADDANVWAILDEAYMNGLYVNVGISIGAEKYGFDYDNEAKVQAQLEAARASVESYRNHPAVLFWSIGNEAEASYTNVKLWDAINAIAEMIHEVDPNHPVTTTLASAQQGHITNIIEKCPALDFLCINSYYPSVLTTADKVKEYGWDKALMITEYGPRGTWAMNPEPSRVLPWDGPTAGKGALVEETSTEKEARYLEIFKGGIEAKADNCIGSFAFVWGYQKHGEVLNWYGLFNKDGYSYGAVDALRYCWTGEYPARRAPRIENRSAMTMNGKVAEDAISVSAGSSNTAEVTASSPCGASLRYEWIIFKEGAKSSEGSLPDGIAGLIDDNTKPGISFKAPSAAGAYRLYVFVLDDLNKKAASACIPFQVK